MVAVSGYALDKTTEANDLIFSTPQLEKSTSRKDIITVPLKYPETSGDGRYSLKFECTLDSGETKELDFDRVIAKNK